MNKKKYLLNIQSMKETIFSKAIRLSRLPDHISIRPQE
jgi:hypothetical protein